MIYRIWVREVKINYLVQSIFCNFAFKNTRFSKLYLMPKRAFKKYKLPVEINGVALPVYVYHERRNDLRLSVGRKRITARAPLVATEQDVHQFLKQHHETLKTYFEENQTAKESFLGKGYASGDTLQVGKYTYTLEVNIETRNSHNAKRHGTHIVLNLAEEDSEHGRQKAIKHLLSRAVGAHYLPEIKRRVLELNRLHFQKPITNIYLKYNRSNWGSCSVNGNVNLSTRLLFAPDEVVDYVIIHELAHLIEMNHSPAFWAEVARAMPDYEKAEKWLKKHGKTCDF